MKIGLDIMDLDFHTHQCFRGSGTFLRAHPHHRANWIIKCGRMRLLDHNYAKPHVVLNCVGHWWLRSVIQFDQPLHQDLGHQVENQEATRS